MRRTVIAGSSWKKPEDPWGCRPVCAILDANVAHEVFSKNGTPAGKAFFERISTGSLRLVVGGKLLEELQANNSCREWILQASLAGLVRTVNAQAVDSESTNLSRAGSCESNDLHVIALARLSRARLLYSNDLTLHRDFKNRTLINNPNGKVYSTHTGGQLRQAHRGLLGQTDLCP